MELISRILELVKWLKWALDLIDLYDKRLAAIDGPEAVYTETHTKAKAQVRKILVLTGRKRFTQKPTLKLKRRSERY